MIRNKIVFGAIFTVILLMLVPSISAVEYKTAVDTNTSKFIDELEQKLKTIDSNSPYIDVKLILIIIMNILTTIFYGKPSFIRMITNVLITTVTVQEFVYGENLMGHCSNVDFALVLTFFILISSIVWRLCPVKNIAIPFVLIIRIIGQLIAYQVWLNE